MEPLEAPEAEIRHTVREHLDDLEHRLTRVLAEKLAEREHTIFGADTESYADTCYRTEIDALHFQVARIEQLEAENGQLNVELEEARQRHREHSNNEDCSYYSKANRSYATVNAETKTENSTVDIEEYNRVKEELIRLESDYGKLVWARDHLETKVREQKDSLRQWKEYRKSWILKHPNKRLSHLQPSFAKASSPIIAENCRSSSAPAPPAIPEGFTPSLSGISRSPSPHRNATTDLKENRHEQAVEYHREDPGSQSHEIVISQNGHDTTDVLDSGGVTDATPESEGQAERIKIEPAPGGSSPIIVFERSLKRRRSVKTRVQNTPVHDDNQRRIGADPSTLRPKDEQVSSPLQIPPLIHLVGPHDSLDLDDVGGHLDTPRKRQRMAQERLKSSMVLPLTTAQGEVNMPHNMTADASILYSEGDSPEIDGERGKEANLSLAKNRNLPRKAAGKEKEARKDERIARQHAHNDRIGQRLEAAQKMDPIFDLPRSSSPTTDECPQQPHTPNETCDFRQRKPHLDSPVILRPRDINTPVLPRTSDSFGSRKRACPPSRRDHGAAYVPALAEDGEGVSLDGDALKFGKKSKDGRKNLHDPSDKESRAPPTHNRLGALLARPSPEKSLLIPEEPIVTVPPDQAWSNTPIPRSVYHNRSKGPATPRSLPAKKSKVKHGAGSRSEPLDFEPMDAMMDRYSKSAQAVTKRTTDVPAPYKPSLADYSETRPEHEPLRARPVHRLGLQDFKFNPAHSDHAYHESVRRHDEKKALSGCTDRHCQRCPGLRKHVIDSGYKTAQKPGESESEADWRLMQDYLGDLRDRLGSMSAKKRSELLVEAKVKEFADRYGCHRQAFSRAREPPGLWQVDFPTTQEAAENRAAADVMEREKVQERYWEATRPNGKWMFADE